VTGACSMPRQRMLPGEHGRISEKVSGGRYYAATYVRDSDGRRRRVERSSSKSVEDARRNLQRYLTVRRTPSRGQAVTARTTLSDLFKAWIDTKVLADGVKPQTADSYRAVWAKHGERQLGSLRVTELTTSDAHQHLQRTGQAARLRMILQGMFSLAVRFGVLAVNPIRETAVAKTVKTPTRAATADEFAQIRAAVNDYVGRPRPKGGPHPGRLLPAFIEVMAATGARPNEVLALRWSDVDLLGDPPTVTITGTLIDHGRIAGKPIHRQETRKGDAPSLTVLLPQFGVDALTALVCESGLDGPVFTNRNGGWMSLTNMRRTLRDALPDDLSWVTPHSLRRTVATIVRNDLGAEQAQQQLSHSKLATTEAHYLQRHTRGPDVRATLDRFASAAGESIGKVSTEGNAEAAGNAV
jgi:integrase